MKKVKVRNTSNQTLVYYDQGVRKELKPGAEDTVPAELLKVFSGKIVEVKEKKSGGKS